MEFKRSEEHLERTLKVIPVGAQTFSKSYLHYPVGTSPLFIQRAKGSHVWDIDGNELIDWVSGLCPIILGYCDPDVDNAVKEQIKNGVIFSLPSILEAEVAEMMVDLIPCAEMVRFGKNGSDVTSGAVRIARAYTDRDHVACCGYHGWQDWYIGTTDRYLGVPEAVRKLTHQFVYNDIKSLEKIFDQYPNDVACVIMEPMKTEWPKENFLGKVKALCASKGAVLVFDEVITGFRFALGGVQELFNIKPDLACFGKAMANGYPLSALVGQKDIMRLMDKIHFSFTNGGECLSLAASKATIRKLREKNVLQSNYMLGNILMTAVNSLYAKHYGEKVFLEGHPTRSVMKFPNEAWKREFRKRMFQKGQLILDCHNINYSHSGEDMTKLFSAYDEIMPALKDLEFSTQEYKVEFKIR